MKQLLIIILLLLPLSVFSQESGAIPCSDGIDNDGDGLIDCDDPDCSDLPNDGCATCPAGGISFGDVLLEYVPGCDAVIDVDSLSVLGVSDFITMGTSSNTPEVLFLGDGGWVKIGFTNNLLVNSGNNDPDAWVFEVGTAVEPSLLALRPFDSFTSNEIIAAGIVDGNGDGYYEIGMIAGATSFLDIDATLPGYAFGDLKFDAIEIRDVAGDSDLCNSITPGSDIDAVCALVSIDVECSESSPGELSGGGLACAGGTISASSSGADITGNESLVYLLTNSPTPQQINIIEQNDTGVFDFLNSLNYETTYYIVAAVTDANGLIDFDEECADLSNAVEAVWLTPIEILIDSTCDQDTGEYSIVFEVQGGLPSYSGGTYQISGATDVLLEPFNSVALMMGTLEGVSYSLNAVDDNGCAQSFESDPITCIKTAVSLVEFDGRVLEDGNQLFWSTASEVDNDFFNIQRLRDSNWETIGVIDGAGNSEHLISYVFLDHDYSEREYYRLQMVDFDGDYSTSHTVVLQRNDISNTTIEIYPNPFVDFFNVRLDGEVFQMRLYNTSGQRIANLNSNNIGSYDLSFLVAGIYILELETSEGIELFKIVKE